jgi:hypothetical protein
LKEITLRTWHRKMGILFVLFIAIQAISGLALSFEGLQGLFKTSPAISEQTAPAGAGEAFWVELCDFVHHGAGPIGAVYRIVLGVGIIWMAVTGTMIYIRIRRRTRAS